MAAPISDKSCPVACRIATIRPDGSARNTGQFPPVTDKTPLLCQLWSIPSRQEAA